MKFNTKSAKANIFFNISIYVVLIMLMKYLCMFYYSYVLYAKHWFLLYMNHHWLFIMHEAKCERYTTICAWYIQNVNREFWRLKMRGPKVGLQVYKCFSKHSESYWFEALLNIIIHKNEIDKYQCVYRYFTLILFLFKYKLKIVLNSKRNRCSSFSVFSILP
jgi:hypothetical protein